MTQGAAILSKWRLVLQCKEDLSKLQVYVRARQMATLVVVVAATRWRAACQVESILDNKMS